MRDVREQLLAQNVPTGVSGYTVINGGADEQEEPARILSSALDAVRTGKTVGTQTVPENRIYSPKPMQIQTDDRFAPAIKRGRQASMFNSPFYK